ncbi:unnamed protein product [Sphagnum jensenii]|uniref:Uncharacterized protein n=1 Tax=Sphagnum jensenii TaxID=128206 RepID=A0ABP0VDE4_9BRYO
MAGRQGWSFRSLQSFGVNGCLQESSEVLYAPIFKMEQVGRLADLLAVHFKATGALELNLRTLLTQLIFQAHRAESKQSKKVLFFSKKDSGILEHPIIFECGRDSDKIVLGVSFKLRTPIEFQMLGEIVSSRKPQSDFEKLLTSLDQNSDHLIIKYQSEMNRMEILSFLRIEPKKDELRMVENSLDSVKTSLECLSMSSDDLQPSPPVKAYVNVGDLDSERPMASISDQDAVDASPSGEFLKPITNFDEILTEVPLESQYVDTLMGEPSSESNDNITSDLNEDSYGLDNNQRESFVQMLFKKIKSWFQRKPKRRGFSGGVFEGSSIDVNSIGDASAKKIEPVLTADADAELDLKLYDHVDPTPQTAESLGLQTKELMTELRTGGLQRIISQAKVQLGEIHRSKKNAHLVKWFESLVTGCAHERQKLQILAKKIERGVAQGSRDSQGKQEALMNELRQKEVQVTAQSSALARARQQLAQLTDDMEKLKKAPPASFEVEELKQKYLVSQNRNQYLEEKNQQLDDQIRVLTLEATIIRWQTKR